MTSRGCVVLCALSAVTGVCSSAMAIDDHLLLSEVVLTPTVGEYIEIVNPTPVTVDLTNYYLSDDEEYSLLPGATGDTPPPVIAASDFIVQFPIGASIPPGGVIVVAFDGAGFLAEFSELADFEMKSTSAGTPDMIPTDVGGSAGLTNSGESVRLFFWDGASDLVQDVDMLNVGTPVDANDIRPKNGIMVDGPDPDMLATEYSAEAGTTPQQAGDPGFGFSTKRIALEIGNESGGGNGLTGDDETSELITTTWDGTVSSPFTAPDPGVSAISALATPVPSVSDWGLVVMGVSLLTGLTLLMKRTFAVA